MEPQNDWKQIAKHALVSAFVGAAISFMTIIMQEFMGYLKHLPTNIPGAVVGVATYLKQWSSSHSV